MEFVTDMLQWIAIALISVLIRIDHTTLEKIQQREPRDAD